MIRHITEAVLMLGGFGMAILTFRPTLGAVSSDEWLLVIFAMLNLAVGTGVLLTLLGGIREWRRQHPKDGKPCA